MLILPKLTGLLPSINIQIQDEDKLQGINLADPAYYQQAKVDVLLGADVYGSLLQDGVVQQIGNNNHLTAQQTQLGWILSGRTNSHHCSTTHQPTRHCFTMSSDNELLQLVKSFWMQEEAFHDSSADLTQDDQICLDHFTQTHSRTQEATCRTHAQTTRSSFCKDPQLHQLYSLFLNKYEKLGHMMPSRHVVDIRTICYLPHHGVKKESSSTTKLRVVFNGSQLIDKNKSLNDLLYDGPCLLNNLSDVISRWRRSKIVFSADVEKMYRQIFIYEGDQEKQRILWRPTPTEQIKSYTLKTVTYGLKPAPFLALATLRQLEKDEVPPEDREQSSTLNIQDVEVFKQLGIQWHRKDDTFTFSPSSVSNNTRLNATERKVLSKVAQLFEPLG
ncbi:uncharacterized protein LOC122850923 [Aphidius gifuensis]|uniref:uncharacterized protein LOC122850923 n=1 Tax=Aphidius gifuensis TaxID=684658 RepID=UPI001CDCD2CE|nr:uncharacterized protein LOC122850923 [Aphidius gifuensis]